MMDEIEQYINSDRFVNETMEYLISEYDATKFGYGNYDRFGSVSILNTSVAIGNLEDVFDSFIHSSPNVECYIKYYDRYYVQFVDKAIRKTKEIASSTKFNKLLKQHLINVKLEEMNGDFKV